MKRREFLFLAGVSPLSGASILSSCGASMITGFNFHRHTFELTRIGEKTTAGIL
jgi:hypothetical protein